MKKISIILILIIMMYGYMKAGNKQKIIFDCDIGGDIDDAYAVALILCSPEFDVLGLVIDHGNTPEKAILACKLLYLTGREDIPVIAGRKTNDDYNPQLYWSNGFDKIRPSTQNAADFIIENIKKYPDEVILFTVGPVTNIQEVLEKEPGILKKTRKVISMLGSFYCGYAIGSPPEVEWNVKMDINASRALVNSGADMLFAGLDITTFIKMKEKNRMRLLYRNSPLTDALSGLYSLWLYEDYVTGEDANFFDVVAVGMALWPELFTTRKVHVSVDDKGYTGIDEKKKPNAEIGVSIKADEFMERVMKRLLTQNLSRNK